jgi:hypothetical protein
MAPAVNTIFGEIVENASADDGESMITVLRNAMLNIPFVS